MDQERKPKPPEGKTSQQDFRSPPAGGKNTRGGLRDKTLWDWTQLLIIPLVLAIVGFAFTWTQDRRAHAIEDQRAQDAALQAYLDKMSDLMLKRDLRAEEEIAARLLARARTLTVLERLDAEHKNSVVKFLWESSLVQVEEGQVPIIDLEGADLADTNLRAAILYGADLGRGDEAPGSGKCNTTTEINLVNPQRQTDLSGAELSYANLSCADLIYVNLRNANLSSAIMEGAFLLYADLSEANLSHGDNGLGFGLFGAALSSANLFNADLTLANLDGANLQKASLQEADLSLANLEGTNLQKANLLDAEGITNKGLEYQTTQGSEYKTTYLSGAKFLSGATMPNGQKYEDWLKDKKDSQEARDPS